jgi:3-oxoacyl-[acyl-carrier-protein] synthase-3
VYGVVTGEQFVRSGMYKTVLVIGADVISSFIDWTDRSTCVLFGDGAAAAVLVETATGGILSGVLGSDGRHAELLTICGGGSKSPASTATIAEKQHFLKMNGAEVFKLAVRGMSDSVLLALEKAGVKKDEVACFVPHQANLRIIDAVSERLGVPKEKVFVNLQKYGNTSAASCAIALCEAVEQKKIKRGDKVVLATFGSGLVWASMVLEW